MLILLGVLSVVSLFGSALPAWMAGVLAVPVLGFAGHALRRYGRQPARILVIPGGDASPMLDGIALVRCALQWRGPLAFLAWQDVQGRRGHLAWWPDTLDARQRRELRLAAGDAALCATMAAMAP
ncbi:hypothetical protein [Pseudoxanthomonas sp. GM95]|uniref:hypothetical protein n=1 Tax=Pseudoxanthomonas sp. GM95 TaxID=1881043 RepID=UPI0020C8D0B1|nr:hypothetical protein [Pseudoxanthomonas sp. GM95]